MLTVDHLIEAGKKNCEDYFNEPAARTLCVVTRLHGYTLEQIRQAFEGAKRWADVVDGVLDVIGHDA